MSDVPLSTSVMSLDSKGTTVEIADLGKGPPILSPSPHALAHRLRLGFRADNFFFARTVTWTERHFTDKVQTRRYRCPEAILGKMGYKHRYLECCLCREFLPIPISSLSPTIQSLLLLLTPANDAPLDIRANNGGRLPIRLGIRISI